MRLKYCTGSWLLFTLLKYRGLSDFQITIGLVSLAPTAFTMKVTVICCLDCFHSLVESFVRKSSLIATSLIEIPYVLSTVALQNIWKSLLPRIDSSTRHITRLTAYFHLPDIVAFFPTIKPSVGGLKFITIKASNNFKCFLFQDPTIWINILDTARQNQAWRASFRSEYFDSWFLLWHSWTYISSMRLPWNSMAIKCMCKQLKPGPFPSFSGRA